MNDIEQMQNEEQTAQNILDLDMDFFLENIWTGCLSPEKRIPPESKDYVPKSESYIIEFLENKLGLSKKHRIRGKIVKHHEEAFYYWYELISSQKLLTPFNVVHVDAHSDLMHRPCNCQHIFQKLLGIDVKMRYNDVLNNTIKPMCGDYLIYALACRWINSLTYVVHPKGDGTDFFPFLLEYKKTNGKRSGYFYFSPLFHENEKVEGFLQLPFNPNDNVTMLANTNTQNAYIEASKLEPKVAFEVTNKYDEINHKGNFDFLVFSQSTNYTPQSADFIIELISEYII